MSERDDGIRVRIHDGSDPRIDAILAMTDLAGRRMPLPSQLASLCREAARALSADVVSVYVREKEGDHDVLVMRGNVGLAEGVVGRVRLDIGEGITGFAAEHARPVSVDVGHEERVFKPVPGIGEERFPAYVAVPMRVAGQVVGVLVLQRRAAHPFDANEVALATACAASVAQSIVRAAERRRPVHRGPRFRSVRLAGVASAPGRALGIATLSPTFEGLVELLDVSGARVEEALTSLVKEIFRAKKKRAPHADDGELETLLADQRLRERILESTATGGVVAGLRDVARSYALTPERLREVDRDTSAFLARRAREIEDLALLLAASLSDQLFIATSGILLAPDPPSRVLALVALGRGIGGVAIGAPFAATEPALGLFTEAGVPVVSEVAGLFSWIEPGDRILVDGSLGTVRVHPPTSEVIRSRRRK
jgi:phosphotransferase system enzyme I (PtsP)